MAKIQINNPRQIINGGAKKYYFKVKGLGGPKGDKGDKGDTGSLGPQGPQGNAATVSVGSTTTLPVGYDATVTNSGSIYNAVLDFGIPQGPRGPQGAKGDKGDTGAQGETGPRGPQGEKGTNATVYVGTTTTTNPGTQARVYNSGTDSNAVLNFEIPRGDVGPQPELVQTTGTSTTKAMSQNATTVALAAKQNTIDSSHKLSADLVDDTSTTNKFVTTSEKATWNAKQNALTAGDNIEITGDTISTPAIAPEVVASLPAEGTEGKLYLTPKNYTRSTATGNPITATITDGAGKIESFQLDGDTEQQTYTGKNLLQITRIAAQTKNGVTVTFDGSSFVLDGTATASTDLYIHGSSWGDTSAFVALTAGTYTLSVRKADMSLGGNFGAKMYNTSGSGQRIFDFNANISGVSTTTLDDDSGFTAFYISISPGVTFNNERFYVQLEKGASATDFEKFVGGQPSPSPSYPQPIQTVTGEQTVEIVGKNLFDKNTMTLSNVAISPNIGSANGYTTVYIPCEPNTTYTVQKAQETTRFFVATTEVLPAPGVQGTPISSSASGTVKTFTTGASARYIAVMVRSSSDTLTEAQVVAGVQIELGSTATAYAPYSKQTLPLDLGSIELCKLGDYQDYIWKDGEDWKVHKATGSYTLDGEEPNWVRSGSTTTTIFVAAIASNFKNILDTNASASARAQLRSDYFIRQSGLYSGVGLIDVYNGGSSLGMSFDIQKIPNIDSAKAWVAANKPTIVAVIATPTDTNITDTTLITQLEAIRTATLEAGANTITNSTPAPNLAGDMEIGYYGYNPTNRYDKWLWLDINNEYEQIGS